MADGIPPLVFLSVARPDLDNDYAFQEMLSEEFGVPITIIHEALVFGSIRPLEQDENYSDLTVLYEALTQFEDIDAKSLLQLVQEEHARVIILMEDERCDPEVLVAFGILVAGYARTLPEVLCVHLEGCAPDGWQISQHIQLDSLLPDATMAKKPDIHTDGKESL
jgi:hypothetical protein